MTLTHRVLEAAQEVEQGRRWGDSETLIRADELPTSAEEAESLVQALVSFYLRYGEKHGFPFPASKETYGAALEALRKEDLSFPLRPGVRAGVSLLKGSFRSFWESKTVPAFRQAKTLERVIRYQTGLNKSGEKFDISLASIRRGLQVQRHVLSFFPPMIAAQVYNRHLPSGYTVVWDPAGGFGSRMLSLAAVRPHSCYIANEPATLIREDLARLAGWLPLDVQLHSAGSEQAHAGTQFDRGSLDLVFTSPPYFDKERYFDEPGQCWKDYPTIALWSEGYLLPTLLAAREGLKGSGTLVLNVSHSLASLVTDTAKKAGFKAADSYLMPLRADHYTRAKGKTANSEPFLVFRPHGTPADLKFTLWTGVGNPRLLPEVWVEFVAGRYRVSNKGRAASNTRGTWTLLNPHLGTSGYYSIGVTLSDGTRSNVSLVHQIVLRAFDGEAPTENHTDIRHLDGNKANNALENLAWGTREENMQDAVRHKRDRKRVTSEGPRRWSWYSGDTSNERLLQIGLEFHAEGKLNMTDLARLWGCTISVAASIVHGETRADIARPPKPEKQLRRTTERKQQILELVAKGMNAAQINDVLGETLTAQDVYYYRTRL
jgi:hypothetical protein